MRAKAANPQGGRSPHLQAALDAAVSHGAAGCVVLTSVTGSVPEAGRRVHNQLAQLLQGLDVCPLRVHLHTRLEGYQKLPGIRTEADWKSHKVRCA